MLTLVYGKEREVLCDGCALEVRCSQKSTVSCRIIARHEVLVQSCAYLASYCKKTALFAVLDKIVAKIHKTDNFPLTSTVD